MRAMGTGRQHDGEPSGSGGSMLALYQGGAVGVVVASALFVAALWWFKRGSGTGTANNDGKVSANVNDSWVEAAAKSADAGASSTEDDGQPKGDDGKLRNVFSVKQKPIVHGNGSGRKQASADRPFESSYYFAHNQHSTGGGYKDGLRAEDYVMNGPKLLSKGGVRVEDEQKSETGAEADGQTSTEPIDDDAPKERPKRQLTASTPITKYLWDDGDVAKIHIDSLPISSTKTIKWEDASGISKEQAEVRLIGEHSEGLYVAVAHEGKRYHLHVPKMYGEAESAKCIVKKHKLLVKITKKKVPKRRRRNATDSGVWAAATNALGKFVGAGGDSTEDEYISVAWPRLSASSTGGLGGGTAEIDEKLFKEMDITGGGDLQF
ncbi:hypothetical protein ACHAXT_008314 [Thalassiosira profunda]